MERKKHTIIYTTIDKQTREFMWETGNENLAKEIVHYLQNGEWSEAASEKSDGNWNADWGLIGPNVFDRNCGYISLPNSIQYWYYHLVLSGITKALGEECVENQDFAKTILKNASAMAKEKDNKYNEDIRTRNPQFIGSNRHQEMLKRAKNRLNYTRRKAVEKNESYYLDEQASTYAHIIEEYGLFSVLEILV